MSKKNNRYLYFFCKNICVYQKKAVLLHPLLEKVVSLAQLVEQLTLNQWVEGSSPSGDTNKKDAKRHLFLFYRLSANRSASSIWSIFPTSIIR